VEKQEERSLGKILLQISQIRSQIEKLATEILNARKALDQAMQQTMAAINIAAMTNHIDIAQRSRQELIISLVELDRQRDAQQKKYQAAHTSRRTLSDMLDRQREAYDLERARADQKRLDEIYASRAQRG